jgi:hypothetical protein
MHRDRRGAALVRLSDTRSLGDLDVFFALREGPDQFE